MKYIETLENSNRELELCFKMAGEIVSKNKYNNYNHMTRVISELTVGLYVNIKSLKADLIGYNGKTTVPKVRQSVQKEIEKYNEIQNEL